MAAVGLTLKLSFSFISGEVSRWTESRLHPLFDLKAILRYRNDDSTNVDKSGTVTSTTEGFGTTECPPGVANPSNARDPSETRVPWLIKYYVPSTGGMKHTYANTRFKTSISIYRKATPRRFVICGVHIALFHHQQS